MFCRATHAEAVDSDPRQFCLTNTFNPREDHSRFENTKENYKQHQDFVQGMIFGGNGRNEFVNFAQSALDKPISDLHERSDAIYFFCGAATNHEHEKM